jgi:hypothetical protein
MSDVHQICSLGPSMPFCFFTWPFGLAHASA